MPNYKAIYDKLTKHTDLSEKRVLHQGEFEEYMDRVSKNEELTENDKKVRDIIMKQMAKNQTAENELKDDLPEIYEAKKKYIRDLKKSAQTFARADTKKKEAAQIKARREAAKKELEEIRKRRVINKASEKKILVNQDDLKEPKLYDDKPTNWARRRNPLIGLMNWVGLGSRSQRRGTDKQGTPKGEYHYKSPEWRRKGAIPIQHLSEDKKIRLTGAKFEPAKEVKKDPEKVALVFSGSHGPGAQYIESIKKAYLDQGITVVQLDYRGFGSSTNIDEKGNHVSNSPSERTMYEDGMEMYRYVNEVMGIEPENITLHGFSLGGAIASRVALEQTKKMQNDRIMDGEEYDKTKGLGGVVLHSPMKSMYSAAYETFIPGLKTAAGFAGWAFGGGYNTEEHMLELAKIDPNVPVHLIGGDPNRNSNNFDHLSPEVTGLDRSLQGKFTSVTQFQGRGDHEGKTWDANNDFDEYVPNVDGRDRGLSSIIDNGRAANPAVREEMQRRANVNENPQMENNGLQIEQNVVRNNQPTM